MLEPLYLLKARKGDWTQLHKHIGQMIAAALAEVRAGRTASREGLCSPGAQAFLWKLTSWSWQPARLFSQDMAPATHNTTLFRGGR